MKEDDGIIKIGDNDISGKDIKRMREILNRNDSTSPDKGNSIENTIENDKILNKKTLNSIPSQSVPQLVVNTNNLNDNENTM